MTNRIPPRSGAAFEVKAGQTLTVTDPMGGQVSDLVAFWREDIGEWLSNGRTFDYGETIRVAGEGTVLWSNRSRPMLTITRDDVGVHDFLLTPCSREMWPIVYPDEPPHRGCLGNLAEALAPYGVTRDAVPTAFNVFMNVPVRPDGRLSVEPPVSKAGDSLILRAELDLIVGLTACSAGASNGGTFKPIDWRVSD
ncbi:DUF1989 domain-containing protein [Parvularcula dongshanensis]|uniref:DUF1989 domain-containing protein n=1 Tax=Parvularcula dongshanensis TaxID=1173995 RepID=A0A840I747_9PROT|nr:urea carboxylase-associated family protein [Parvularcula dongshanensis]MBB4660322.1 hypothetical protein [Parvularcula dongshanensis]